MKLKLLSNLNERIHQDNPDDPSNPEVSVQGVGVWSLEQVVRNVTNKIADLNDHVVKAKTKEDWSRVQWMIEHAAMGALIQAIIDTKDELEERAGTKDEMSDVPVKARGI